MKTKMFMMLSMGFFLSSCEKEELPVIEDSGIQGDTLSAPPPSSQTLEILFVPFVGNEPTVVACPDYPFFMEISGLPLETIQQAYDEEVIVCPDEIAEARPLRTPQQIFSEFDQHAVGPNWHNQVIGGFKYLCESVFYHMWRIEYPQETWEMTTEELLMKYESNEIAPQCGGNSVSYCRFLERMGYEAFSYSINFPGVLQDPTQGHAFSGFVGPDGEYYLFDPTFKDYLKDNQTGLPLSLQDAFEFVSTGDEERIGFSPALVRGTVLSPTASLMSPPYMDIYYVDEETIVREAPYPGGMRYRIEGKTTRDHYLKSQHHVEEFDAFFEVWSPELEQHYPGYNWTTWTGNPDDYWKLIFIINTVYDAPESAMIYQEIVEARGF